MGRRFWLVVGTILSWSKDVMWVVVILGSWFTYVWFKTTDVVIESKGFHHEFTEYVIFPMVAILIAVGSGNLLIIWVARVRSWLLRV
ncbi:hypothetical protein FT641_19310 [Bacillus paranthracis]|uniref:hypothetical protein n=1 Tax=Bacillus paranthracis TaxID=2026186 RepID=UPI00187907EF|nr:hypothetical protein [Bacillus paranthracis]MBE7114286.1 hypothetical protein [Bacillus paranthracis]MBE7154841.1 hypothetical protein [Bacillus paranthracis]